MKTKHDQAGPATDADAGGAYRFDTFTTGLLLADMRYRRGDPGPGDPLPTFDLPTLDGSRLRSDALGSLPVVLIFGSRTCPITHSAVPRLKRLAQDHADRVRFVLVYTREAHPGGLVGQPRTAEDKQRHAASLRDDHSLDFEVAIDDLDGGLHRRLGPKPNSAYVVDPEGIIRYRAHWANDDAGIRRALDAVLDGRRPRRGRSRAMVRPLMAGAGHLPTIVRVAGSEVERDVWRAAPPLAVLARVSDRLGFLPTDRRGPVAAVIVALAVAALVAAVVAIGG